MSLVVRGLNKTFRDKLTLKQRQVLFDVGFSVPDRSITGFLGSNGAGKTTTMKSLLGLLKYERGDIEFFRGELADPRAKIGYLPERPYFYDYLTGREFLTFYGQLSMSLSRADLRQKVDQLLEKVGLCHAKDILLRNYSKGMLQRVGLAQAIIHQPQFLILDEPMSGLDPDGRAQVTDLIRELGQNGTTLFFSSHLLDDVEKLCNRLVIIDRGRILFEGSKADFLQTGEPSYELIYEQRAEGNILRERVPDQEAVQRWVAKLDGARFRLISIQEPRLHLEDAFKKLKEQARTP